MTLLDIDPASLDLDVEVGCNVTNDVRAPTAVNSGKERLRIEAMSLGKCLPMPLDDRAGVDEDTVEVK